MITRIPPESTRRWTGLYPGNYYGTLWKTFNVDLDRSEGKVSLARRMARIEDSTEIPHLSGSDSRTRVRAFLRSNADCTDRYWALTDCGLLKTDSASPEVSVTPDADWDPEDTVNSPEDPLDFTVHGNDSRNDSGRNKLFVTRDTGDIAVLNDTGANSWNLTWWVTTQAQPALTRGILHPIEYFPFRKITVVGDGNLVHTIHRPSDTQNDTITYARIRFPHVYRSRHIFTTTNRVWILADHRFKENGVIVEWDGVATSYNNLHNARSAAALSGVNWQETPIVLNSNGEFLEFTGYGFAPMIRNGQKVAFPCAEEPGNHLLEDTSDTTMDARVDPRGMTVGEDGLIYINRRDPAIPSFRDFGGIWCLNPSTGRLYNKYSLPVDWGDSTDYGFQQVRKPGAIYSVPASTSRRELLASGVVRVRANDVNQSGIWLLEAPSSNTANRGYFITQFIPAEQIREFWDKIWVRFKRFISSTDRIIIKAKGQRSLALANGQPLIGRCTWTSTTTFTVTLASGDDALQVGDEIEVVDGTNVGFLAHITTITGDHAALQTITIDETMTTGTDLCDILFDRWKKLKTITSTTIYHDFANIGIDSDFLQLKVELRGLEREVEVSDLAIVSNVSVKI